MKTYTNINKLNYLSTLLISPSIKVGNIEYNKNLIISEIEKKSNNTNLLIFPELCLTGNTCGDVFWVDSFAKKIDEAIHNIIIASYNFHSTIILGTPITINYKLVNSALFISDGKLLGIVPKINNSRWFSSPDTDSIMINGYNVKISEYLIFQNFCKIGICFGKKNIFSLLDSEIIICFDTMPYSFNYKNNKIIESLSKITNQAILYVGSNTNESTTDYVYNNELLACECGENI